MQCSNSPCKRLAFEKRTGLCTACHSYQRRNGKPRPERLMKNDPVRICRNCQKPAPKQALGMCDSCYSYFHRNGTMRVTKPPPPPFVCRCGSTKHNAKGRCSACYAYFKATGRERPLEPKERAKPRPCANPNCKRIIPSCNYCNACQRYRRMYGTNRPQEMCQKRTYQYAKVKPTACKVCKAPNPQSRGRCAACDIYYRRHNGKPRPRYLWDKEAGCLTCGIPLASLPTGGKRAGRCYACYQYHKIRGGKERPREYWGIGEHGWCKCGRPAGHLRDGKGVCSICKDSLLTGS